MVSRRIARCILIPIISTAVVAASQEVIRVPDNRMAGWHRTMVTINETAPNASVTTYLREQTTAVLANVLVKLAPSVEGIGATQATDVRVEDFPGGVTATFRLGDVRVTTELTPLFVGRGERSCEGAALYTVSTEPASEIAVGLGSGAGQEFGPTPALTKDTLQPLEQLSVDGAYGFYLGGREQVPVAVSVTGELTRVDTEGGAALSARFPSGHGKLLLTFADDPERASGLLLLDMAQERAKVDAYYGKLLSVRIDTPEDDLDKAFRAALYNLEYNWNEPYGWNECIHHWLAMWHNQHTAGAEWIGQEDRSRLCTVTLGEHLLDSGAVPQFTMDGGRRRDFGGSNQFWAWQARHYWKFTGEKAFAESIAPPLDRVLAQTLDEHDPDGNLLVAWGLQIGNQEDFVQFYHDAATPSIELVNMMRTRAELAEGLGDETTAARWHGRVQTALDHMRESLWLPDLGRFASYVDQHGKARLDGQYHTFLYPVIWDIVDELDGYTSLRHVHDRLTGGRGEVYCSNNFPNHDNGTWGMQAGAAQQPWAAWAYSKAGQWDHTYRPLLSIAQVVNNENMRGSWPEVMEEHIPAYFTPPAGLYVAAVVEALFGLYVDKPVGELRVAPSFPEEWPEASAHLAKYGAEYRRKDNKLTYTVRSEERLAPRLKWSLPPSRNIRVTANGEPLDVTVTPGVARVLVEGLAPAATETVFRIEYEPLDCTLAHAGSIAEGEELSLTLEGASIVSVDDRCGVCSAIEQTGPGTLYVRIREGLLAPYLRYGRLGQVTFSRRTFFIACESEGVRFWLPVDITVLPRLEAAVEGEAVLEEETVNATIRIRNNTESAISGRAWLRAAQHDLPIELPGLPARGECRVTVTIPPATAALFSLGDNAARLTMPLGEAVDLTFNVTAPFRPGAPLAEYMAQRLVPIPIPGEDTSPYAEWTGLREGSHGGAVPWPGWVQPLEGMETQSRVDAPDLPGLHFEVHPGRWVLIGERIGKAAYRLEVEPQYYRKFFLLMATFVDNHDMFTKLGHITVRGPQGVVTARPIYFPGDVDWWEHNGMAQTMGTARFGRANRFGLLPLLSADMDDWADAPPEGLEAHPGLILGGQRPIEPAWIPPSFPQPELWATSRVVDTPNCAFNIIEIDLKKPLIANAIDIDTVGICPGFALFSAVAETTGNMDVLEGSPWLPEPAHREPRLLFDLSKTQELTGWTLDGAAFGEAIGQFSLNTLVAGGEGATGSAMSPAFAIPSDGGALKVEFHGGHNRRTDDGDNLCLRLLDAATGEVLRTLSPPGTHILSTGAISLDGLGGHQVQIQLYDANTSPSYAWIGLRKVSLVSGE